VRNRTQELLTAVGEAEGEYMEGEESVKWFVETALRCNALGVISSSPHLRATFAALLRTSTFPHPQSSTDSTLGAGSGGGVAALVASAGYVVVGTADAAPRVVARRASELLPLAVLQLLEAGDVIGAGTLVLRATGTHSILSSSSSAAVVALQAYLVRIQSAADSSGTAEDAEAQRVWVGVGVQRRCQQAVLEFEKMLSAAR